MATKNNSDDTEPTVETEIIAEPESGVDPETNADKEVSIEEGKDIEIAEYLHSKKGDVCKVIGLIISEFQNEERIGDASFSQLSSVMGMLIDKFGADERDKNSEGHLAEIFGDFEDVK